jgi:hypothetical protein
MFKDRQAGKEFVQVHVSSTGFGMAILPASQSDAGATQAGNVFSTTSIQAISDL